MWIAITLFFVALLFFLVIARKGRRLRTAHVLPPETDQAFLETAGGERHSVRTTSHFYIGSKADSDVVISSAKQDYEVCIFYHRKRFAFQTLSGSRGIRVNDEEILAGYLTNGDVLEIEGEKFLFRCN